MATVYALVAAKWMLSAVEFIVLPLPVNPNQYDSYFVINWTIDVILPVFSEVSLKLVECIYGGGIIGGGRPFPA